METTAASCFLDAFPQERPPRHWRPNDVINIWPDLVSARSIPTVTIVQDCHACRRIFDASHASMTFVNSSLVGSNVPNGVVTPFLITGLLQMTVSNSSTLAFRNCVMTADNGTSFSDSALVSFMNYSNMILHSCSVSSLASTAPFDMSSVSFSDYTFSIIASSTAYVHAFWP